MSIYQTIQDFIDLALENGAIESLDEIYLRNQLLHFLGVNDWQGEEINDEFHEKDSLVLLDRLVEIAQENKMFDPEQLGSYKAALMDFITPKPSKVNHNFWKKYQDSPKAATDYFYALAKQVDQVKTREIAKNILFNHQSKYGELEITINLSKPEKDPKVIAAAKSSTTKLISYPACQLCLENEGFYGRTAENARSNHRVVRLTLNDKPWGLQYSPYAYYNEHSIVLNEKHQAMKIDRQTFANLFAFLDLFPHYMIGSNADLPIVGGSILLHDHYQAGRHVFPMMKAKIKKEVKLSNFSEIKAGILNWPMSALRLIAKDKEKLIAASEQVLSKWQAYSDESLSILAIDTNGVQHHTITPIAYKSSKNYVIDLVLRDNNVSQEFPDGIFHPHPDSHHIKKENIGLIEVMGMAILPPRLKDELPEVEKYLLDEPNRIKEIHKPWADKLKAESTFTPENVQQQVRAAVGDVFTKVLQDAGVFKDNSEGAEGFERFIAFLNE